MRDTSGVCFYVSSFSSLVFCRNISVCLADYIVSHITGTRFSLLNEVTEDMCTMERVKAWGEMLHLKTKAALAANGVEPGHAMFGRMLDASGQKLNSARLADDLPRQREAMVKANVVLAAHTDETFTCASRHVVEAFKTLRKAEKLDKAERAMSEPADS